MNDRRVGEGAGTLDGDEWSAPSTYTTVYDYDEAGALTDWGDNAVASDKDKALYTYDSEGQRLRTVLTEDWEDSTPANRTITTTDYLYDGLKLVSQTITKTDGAGTPINSWQLFWFYDASGRPYAGIDRKLSTTAGSTHSFYLVTDDRGDVVELLEADHIAFGSYRYDAYGRPTETTARETSTTAMHYSWMEPITSERNPLRYAGYVYDTHSGLYYLQRRYYDAITRQFLSRDPLKSDGNESPYQYCGGNPVSGTDPWGLRMIIAESGGGKGGKETVSLKHLYMLYELRALEAAYGAGAGRLAESGTIQGRPWEVRQPSVARRRRQGLGQLRGRGGQLRPICGVGHVDVRPPQPSGGAVLPLLQPASDLPALPRTGSRCVLLDRQPCSGAGGGCAGWIGCCGSERRRRCYTRGRSKAAQAPVLLHQRCYCREGGGVATGFARAYPVLDARRRDAPNASAN